MPPPQPPQPPQRPVKRGGGAVNPLVEQHIIIYRGTAEGVPRVNHGQAGGPHGGVYYHDGGQGLYGTRQAWLAEGYARTRAYEAGGAKPLVLYAVLAGHELPPRSKILDLATGTAAAEWQLFLRQQGKRPGGLDVLGNVNLRRQFWGKPYFDTLLQFLKATNRSLDSYSLLVLPEYVKDGVQLVIRDPALEKKVLQRMATYAQKRHWVRCYDSNGDPFDTDINDAREYEQNKRWSTQKMTKGNALMSQQDSTKLRTLFRSDGRYAPGTRVAAAGMGLIEVARIVFGLWLLHKHTPTKFARIQNDLAYEIRFWRRRGVEVTIAAMVTGGSARSKGVTGQRDGATYPATGKVLWGLAYEDPKKVDLANVKFFTAYHDGVYVEDPKRNPLFKHIVDLRRLIRFLQEGVTSRFLLADEDQVSLPIIDRSVWWLPSKQPVKEGEATLEEIYWPLDWIVERLKAKLMREETADIQTRNHTVWPENSRIYWNLGTDAGKKSLVAVGPGQGWLKIRKERVWRFKQGRGAFYSVMTDSARRVEVLGGAKAWGTHTPTFYQVGETDVGSPFLLAKGMLMTGADARTNAVLYEYMWRNEKRCFVARSDSNVPFEPGVDFEDTIKSWVHVPLVYVEVSELV